MKPIDLILLQINLEYRLIQDGRLVPFPDSTEQALYIVYRHTLGTVHFFNHQLPRKACQRLIALGPAKAFDHPDEVIGLISESYMPCRGGDGVYWSGYFAQMPKPDEFPAVTREEGAWVVKVDGQIVSKAFSVRQNVDCAEVYVETLPDYRCRGYGRQTVAAWARDILNNGQVPFYSYHQSNRASGALAGSLGVEWYADVVAYESL